MAQSVDSSDASPGAESVDASSIEQLTDRWLSSRVSARASSGPLAPGSPRATLSHSPGPGSYSPTALRAGGCTFSNKAGSAFGSATSVRAHHAMLSDGPLGKARQGGPGPGEFKQAMTTLRSGGATLGGSAVPDPLARHHDATTPLSQTAHSGKRGTAVHFGDAGASALRPHEPHVCVDQAARDTRRATGGSCA
eukprot:CAMPEP_0196688270 /NCGR_PEP_ID=MMETSP1090-20130531/15904_1 /TAXON_ID=37098 /ORGANISM="Isochrysis sp, Strain CCMP1244" /LENGTH=193 /DNA_ID=CAMNT_0042027145 /DNA_START=32 /DNA_END=614 /DNA_ORIENTATION=-